MYTNMENEELMCHSVTKTCFKYMVIVYTLVLRSKKYLKKINLVM
jgi:hypothetical protein